MSNLYQKRWQALRFVIDVLDLAVDSDLKEDIDRDYDFIKSQRNILLEMQEDNLLNARSAKNVDAEALDAGIAKRDFIQNYGEITTQITLYRLLADGQELVVKTMQGTVMFPALQQQKLARQLDELVSETEKFSGRKFQ